MNGRKIAVVALVFALLFTSLMPQGVNAQDIPLRDDQSPIVEICQLLWEQSKEVFLVTCAWMLAIPLVYVPIGHVLPEPPPPTPTPTPTPPSFVNFDPDADAMTIQEECPDGRCDEYGYILFTFEDLGVNDRKCLAPHASTMMFDDDNQTIFPKSPYFISLQPREDAFGYVAKVKRFTNNNNWAQAWHYDLAIFCAE